MCTYYSYNKRINFGDNKQHTMKVRVMLVSQRTEVSGVTTVCGCSVHLILCKGLWGYMLHNLPVLVTQPIAGRRSKYLIFVVCVFDYNELCFLVFWFELIWDLYLSCISEQRALIISSCLVLIIHVWLPSWMVKEWFIKNFLWREKLKATSALFTL